MSQALTGSALLVHHRTITIPGLTKGQAVIQAGYVRDNERPKFCDYYTSVMQATVQEEYKNRTKKTIVNQLLDAIQYKMPLLNVAITNNEFFNGSKVVIYYDGLPIAVIRDQSQFPTNNISMGHHNIKNQAIKTYCNAIARYFAGGKVTERNGVWWIGTGASEEVFTGDWHYLTAI
jgi:hypothetical protein